MAGTILSLGVDSIISEITVGSPVGGISGGSGAVSSVFGRAGNVTAQGGDYSFSQISGTVQPTQMPLFTATAEGAVPASGGGSVNFLRADGSWMPISGGGGTVTSVAMTVPSGLAVAGSPITGAGTLGLSWSGTIPAAQLPLFTATANGAVVASGGGTVNFLRADGTWVPAPGGGGAGNLTVGTTTIVGGTTGNVLYDNAGVLGEKAIFGSPTTVAGLPSAATAGTGARGFVTDSTSTSFAQIVAGSGINRVPVYSDGTNWRIG